MKGIGTMPLGVCDLEMIYVVPSGPLPTISPEASDGSKKSMFNTARLAFSWEFAPLNSEYRL